MNEKWFDYKPEERIYVSAANPHILKAKLDLFVPGSQHRQFEWIHKNNIDRLRGTEVKIAWLLPGFDWDVWEMLRHRLRCVPESRFDVLTVFDGEPRQEVLLRYPPQPGMVITGRELTPLSEGLWVTENKAVHLMQAEGRGKR